MRTGVKTTSPFRYDLNQIPYGCLYRAGNKQIQETRSDRVPEELWAKDYNTVQEVVTKTIPKEKKYKMSKWLSEEALQIAEKRGEAKGKGETER